MKTYIVYFETANYEMQAVRVTAKNKTEIKKIMRTQYGNDVKINDIEVLNDWDFMH